jgi:hypothetical protein
MVRTMTFVVAILSAAAIVAAQAPAQPAPPKGGGDAPAIQQPAPTTPPSSPGQKPMASSAGKVTYTGCVKPGSAADSWILENAEIAGKETAAAGAAGEKPAGAAGEKPSGVATAGAKKTFNLDPAASVDLKTHANHKVELIGTLAPSKPGAGATDRQEFRVESLKMVAATCP